MPKERPIISYRNNDFWQKITELQKLDSVSYNCFSEGYNQALSDFRLWQAKCLLNLEKVIQNKLGLLNENKIKELAQAIRNLFGGTKTNSW